MLTCRLADGTLIMANPQSSFATDTRIVHMCNLVAECGRNRLSGCYATSGQKAKLSQASQPFYSHSQRSRIPICVDSSQKLDSESEMLPTPAPNFAYCWPLPAPSWQSGRQLHPLPLISSLLHGTKNICMSPDP